MLQRIAITGPECSGKSALSAALAKHFHTTWVPEFARLYLEDTQGAYQSSDLLAIAKGQLAFEQQKSATANRFLFCDTDMLVIHIWHQVVFQAVHPAIEQLWLETAYDHYLLCKPDLPWEDDPLREHPHLREHLFELYKAQLTDSNRPFTVIEGLDSEIRIQKAIQALSKPS